MRVSGRVDRALFVAGLRRIVAQPERPRRGADRQGSRTSATGDGAEVGAAEVGDEAGRGVVARGELAAIPSA